MTNLQTLWIIKLRAFADNKSNVTLARHLSPHHKVKKKNCREKEIMLVTSIISTMFLKLSSLRPSIGRVVWYRVKHPDWFLQGKPFHWWQTSRPIQYWNHFLVHKCPYIMWFTQSRKKTLWVKNNMLEQHYIWLLLNRHYFQCSKRIFRVFKLYDMIIFLTTLQKKA